MNDLREQLASVIEFSDHLSHKQQADAVIAAMPRLVQPLVWRCSYGVWRAETPFGDYKVSGGILTLPLPMNPQQVYPDEEAAKAAAQAHHVATILSAFGVQGG